MAIILLEFGLSNRLRTIVAFLYMEKILKKPFTFHWKKDKECPGYFDEVLELKDYPSDKIQNINPSAASSKLKPNYFFCGQDTIEKLVKKFLNVNLSKKDISHIESTYYSKFVPRVHIKDEINKFLVNNIFPHYSMHIRRTDHIALAKRNNKYTEDNIFIKFVKTHEDGIIYLATDNVETQLYFLKSYPNVQVYKIIDPPQVKIKDGKTEIALRQTNLDHSLVDIFICAMTDEFIGSEYSSYSHLIRIYSNLYKNNEKYFQKHIFDINSINFTYKKTV